MRAVDRFFWVTLRRFWPRWKETLVIIRPDTVVRWHRAGFWKFWTWKSRRRESHSREADGWTPRWTTEQASRRVGDEAVSEAANN